MNAETIFSIVNHTTVEGCLLLVLEPPWNWTLRIVISGVITLLISVDYLTLIVFFLQSGRRFRFARKRDETFYESMGGYRGVDPLSRVWLGIR